MTIPTLTNRRKGNHGKVGGINPGPVFPQQEGKANDGGRQVQGDGRQTLRETKFDRLSSNPGHGGGAVGRFVRTFVGGDAQQDVATAHVPTEAVPGLTSTLSACYCQGGWRIGQTIFNGGSRRRMQEMGGFGGLTASRIASIIGGRHTGARQKEQPGETSSASSSFRIVVVAAGAVITVPGCHHYGDEE